MGWATAGGEAEGKGRQGPWGEVTEPRCPEMGGGGRTAQLGEATKWTTTEGTDGAGKLRNDMLPEFKRQSHT